MDISTDMVLGVALLLFGLYTLIARQAAPNSFSKLELMKERWGEKGGTAIHIAGYTLLPLLAGTIILVAQFV